MKLDRVLRAAARRGAIHSAQGTRRSDVPVRHNNVRRQVNVVPYKKLRFIIHTLEGRYYMSQQHTFPTSIGDITITQAQLADIVTITGILEEAAFWITSLGLDQWQPGSFLDTASQKRIAQNMNHGEVYLASYEKQTIGTITVQEGGALDEELWGHETLHDALYIHRVAIRRTFAGKGIGEILLHWAEQLAIDAGKTFLRLDCMADNAALCAYYERYGFTCRGIIGENWKASLYEIRTGASPF